MTIHRLADEVESELIPRIVGDLRGGRIWGLPADSSYALVADAFNIGAVQKIDALKGRTGLMSPILIGRLQNLDGIVAAVTDSMRKLAEAFWPGPLTVVVRPTPSLIWAASSDAITVRMPANAATRQVAWELGPLFGISAARADATPPLTADAGAQLWGSSVSDWLDAGPADPAQLSTVVDLRGAEPAIIRPGALSQAEIQAVLPDIGIAAD